MFIYIPLSVGILDPAVVPEPHGKVKESLLKGSVSTFEGEKKYRVTRGI